MSLQGAKQELQAAHSAMNNITAELPGIAEYYTDFSEHCSTLEDDYAEALALLRDASEEYERCGAALRRAWGICEERILPNLEASGLDKLDSDQAQNTVAQTRAIQPALRPILDFVLEHVVREVFNDAVEANKGAIQGTRDYVAAFTRTFVGPNTNLAAMQTKTEALAEALREYIGKLG